MNRKGNCWDNAVAESFFKSLKIEWGYKHTYNYRSQAELLIFSWIKTWYNKRRIHSYLGNKTFNENQKLKGFGNNNDMVQILNQLMRFTNGIEDIKNVLQKGLPEKD